MEKNPLQKDLIFELPAGTEISPPFWRSARLRSERFKEEKKLKN